MKTGYPIFKLFFSSVNKNVKHLLKISQESGLHTIEISDINFSYFSMKKYVVGSH